MPDVRQRHRDFTPGGGSLLPNEDESSPDPFPVDHDAGGPFPQPAGREHQAGAQHGGDGVDDAGAAQSPLGRPAASPRAWYATRQVPGSISTRWIAPGTARMPCCDVRPLERRPGGAARDPEAFAVSEYDFSVRSDIDDQGNLLAQIGSFGRRTAPMVSPPTKPETTGKTCTFVAGTQIEAERAGRKIPGARSRPA
jgi:hypothetical protein